MCWVDDSVTPLKVYIRLDFCVPFLQELPFPKLTLVSLFIGNTMDEPWHFP